ncbi:hypothetical protein [Halobaculum magnesiiphilum]|uniref:Uncharacterized protein n=1 Tax=Halobaculum magnesiiphilum TaxID=1017351 RepID=A0A8T8WAY1_9EURY|nr:hypothetical protein [Halobaculum magnesiiphilum]QZP36988.1 hypothetical protein K6T50_11895 [Halobaculum magnesiiphilum]
MIAQFALWTAGAVGVQLVLGVSWGSPASALDPAALADAALVGACVAVGALAVSPLSMYGRDIVGVFVGTVLLTLLSTTAFGADASTVDQFLSLAGGYGVFVALAYTVGWALDGVVRRGVIVEDGAATFAGPR